MECTYLFGFERSEDRVEDATVVENDQIVFMPFWKEYEEHRWVKVKVKFTNYEDRRARG